MILPSKIKEKNLAKIDPSLGKSRDLDVLLVTLQTDYLRQVLEKTCRGTIVDTMPYLTSLLLETRYQKWLEWQTLQKYFLQEQNRNELRQIKLI